MSMFDLFFKAENKCSFCKSEKKVKYNLCNQCIGNLEFVDGKYYINNEVLCIYPLFYNSFIRNYIAEYKFKNKVHLAETFAQIMYDEGKKRGIFDDIDGIIYIPLSDKSFCKRGYNHIFLIAEYLSKYAHIPILNVLDKHKDTKNQHYLDVDERQVNLTDAFTMNDKSLVRDKNILIIDDFITTGSTLKEVIKELGKANYKSLTALVLTSSKDPQFP